MELYEKKTVVKDECCGYKCDGCGIESVNADGWHHFSSGHSEWGYDSIDSFKYYDVCSLACFKEILKELTDQWPESGYPSLEVGDFGYSFIKQILE